MLSNKRYKFRIYPNKEQSSLINKTFGSVRFLYNRMLSDKIDYYEKTKESLYVSPKHYKAFYPWLNDVGARTRLCQDTSRDSIQ